MKQRRGLRSACAVALALALPLLMDGCGIDLTDDLSGKPCKDGECLDGWVCRNDICVPEDSVAPGGSGGGGAGGSTGGNGGGAGLSSAGQDASAGNASVGGQGDAGDTGGSGGVGGVVQIVDAGDAAIVPDGSVDSAPDAPPSVPVRTGFADCNGNACDLAAERCCISTFPGYPDPPQPDAFSCTLGGSGCDWALLCDGDHDCSGSDVCCTTQGLTGTTTQCAGSCTLGGIHVECTAAEDCGPGTVCCGRLVTTAFGTPSHYDRILCQSSCSGGDDRMVCKDTSECAGGTCLESSVFPGIKTCQ